jgi:hypothetical protein
MHLGVGAAGDGDQAAGERSPGPRDEVGAGDRAVALGGGAQQGVAQLADVAGPVVEPGDGEGVGGEVDLRPRSAVRSSAKLWSSAGMSSLRSRSGGTVSWSTPRRW